MNLVTRDQIDFSAYLHETEPAQKVRAASLYVQELIDELGQHTQQAKHRFLPWDKTHGLFHFRPGEVTLWGGVNGHGKSLVTGMCGLSLAAQGDRVCIASFEMKPKRTLERMSRQYAMEHAHSDFGRDPAGLAYFRDSYAMFKEFVDKRLWFYDQQGTVDVDTVIAVIRYCAKELGIKQFFVDSLMKCVKGEDDYNGQKQLVDELTAIARDHDMHIHLVHHIRKLSNEETQPDKNDVKGSGAICDQVDNLMLVWRNKRKERDAAAGKKVADDEPDALLICDKQRNGDWEGRIGLWFDKASTQFVQAHGAEALLLGTFPHGRTE